MTGSVVRALLLGLLPVALAAGVWRVERDRPGWLLARDVRGRGSGRRRPRPSRRAWSSRSTIPGTERPPGPAGRWRHWNHARLGMPEPARILGFHDPRRVDRARPARPRRDPLPGGRALRQPRPGAHSDPAGPGPRRGARRARRLLVGARARGGARARRAVPARGRGGSRARAVLRDRRLRRRGALGVAADLEPLLDRHGSEPAWLRVDGAPVVFLYASHRPATRPPGTPCAPGWRREAGACSSSPT